MKFVNVLLCVSINQVLSNILPNPTPFFLSPFISDPFEFKARSFSFLPSLVIYCRLLYLCLASSWCNEVLKISFLMNILIFTQKAFSHVSYLKVLEKRMVKSIQFSLHALMRYSLIRCYIRYCRYIFLIFQYTDCILGIWFGCEVTPHSWAFHLSVAVRCAL